MKLRGYLLLSLFFLCASSAVASTPGTIAVFFDEAGTQRVGTPTGAGDLVTLYIYGSDFPGWLGGAQYRVEYGPNLRFITDILTPPVTIGTSAAGISMGFGLVPRTGEHSLFHQALCEWTTGDCETAVNVDGPYTTSNPNFPEPSPAVTRFWHNTVWPAGTARSQTCQFIELDVKPGACPNPFPANAWKHAGTESPANGGVIKVAILGSSTVDVSTIDVSSLLLEGAAPLSSPGPQSHSVSVDGGGKQPQGHHGPRIGYAGEGTGTSDCYCPHGAEEADRGREPADPYSDLILYFNKRDIAEAIGPRSPYKGEEIQLTLTGAYEDGMPISATDCVVIVGGRSAPAEEDDDGDRAGDTGELYFPQPNPFNPVTRIRYSVPSTQRVDIAVYDVVGRLVEGLVEEVKTAGDYVVEWDAGTLPSGVYFFRMRTGNQTVVRRATLIK